MNLKLRYIVSETSNPYVNLALEEQLTFNVKEDECILYLWQNANTVVIGKNQNAWKECNVSLLEEAGGKVARRMSGGGAVFHDMGNLNFTFCARRKNFNKDRQTKVILEALNLLGIKAVRNGRNDLLINERKFSGHAYFYFKDFCYHHGTLMFDVDKEDAGKFLNVSKAKLESKGVDSVKSRIINIKDVKEDITLDALRAALVKAFEHEYGGLAIPFEASTVEQKLSDKYSSFDWIFGREIPFSNEFSNKFQWGEVSVRLMISEGIISECKCFTDALDVEIAESIEKYLIGRKYSKADILDGKKDFMENSMVNDVMEFIANEI